MIVPLTFALAIIAFAAAFHLHWALGGRVGYSVSLPQREDGQPVMAHRLPWWRPAAFGVAAALIALAVLALSVAGWLDLAFPRPLQRAVLGAAGSAFCLRVLLPNRYVGLFKSIQTTRWARYDTRLYSPLFLILGFSLVAVAVG